MTTITARRSGKCRRVGTWGRSRRTLLWPASSNSWWSCTLLGLKIIDNNNNKGNNKKKAQMILVRSVMSAVGGEPHSKPIDWPCWLELAAADAAWTGCRKRHLWMEEGLTARGYGPRAKYLKTTPDGRLMTSWDQYSLERLELDHARGSMVQ